MAIHEKIKKLVKTLGGVPKSDTIEGAVDDLVGLFTEKREVEMVEFIPEQHITSMYGNNQDRCANLEFAYPLVAGQTYTVTFDGMRHDLVAKKSENTVYIDYDENDNGYLNGDDFHIWYDAESSGVTWSMDKDLSATISIIGDLITVTPPVVSLPRVEKKMVEIVPEQSVLGRQAGLIYTATSANTIKFDFRPLADHKYKIKLNDLVVDIVAAEDSIEYRVDGKTNPDFAINYRISDNFVSMMWAEKYGNTITLAIYEEQEVIVPLDPKFVGGGICFKCDVNRNLTCSHTYDEVKAIVFSGNPYSVCLLSYDEYYGGWYNHIGKVNRILEDGFYFRFWDYSYEIDMSSSGISFISGEA